MSNHIVVTLAPDATMADAEKIIQDIEIATGKPNQAAEIVTTGGTKPLQVKANPNANVDADGLAKAIAKTNENPSIVNLAKLFPIAKTEDFEGLALGSIAAGTSLFEGTTSYTSVVGDHTVVTALNGKALHNDQAEVQEDEFIVNWNSSIFGLTSINAAKYACLTDNLDDPVIDFRFGPNSQRIAVLYNFAGNIRVIVGGVLTDTGVAKPTANNTVEVFASQNLQQISLNGTVIHQAFNSWAAFNTMRMTCTGVAKKYDDMVLTLLDGTP